jgi:hypothetical protein
VTAPQLGLLLDIDGPIASPVTRSISIESILHDLVALTALGVPIAFITGRSDEFVREKVMAPLLEAGLGEALSIRGTRMFAVFEKGATWSTVGPLGLGELELDTALAMPSNAVESIRRLHERDFLDFMFFDETKHAMISIEQRMDVPNDEFLRARLRFADAAFDAIAELGLGVRLGDRVAPAVDGSLPYRIDPTIISIDIESVELDKDRGAQRALDHFASTGPLPALWRSVGDSRSDYLMADYVHSKGLDVAHVDVRPADGILDRPYEILTEGDLIHDDAGAAFLRYWAQKLA